MNIGIDKIGFSTTRAYLDMHTLAEARDVEPNKYIKGLGQDQMAIPSESEDAVTLAAQAADQVLTAEDKAAIDMVLIGSESGVDQSKSLAVWVHELLGVNPYARSVELKQACYSATAALKMAVGHIHMNPSSKVLVIGSDIAKYGLNTGGEPTQGAGAVAMLISQDPAIATVHNDSVALTRDIADFWRPNYSDYAYVDGKFSNEAYLTTLESVWQGYKEKTGLKLEDFKALLFHTPYTKMGKKALLKLGESEDQAEIDRLLAYHDAGRYYNKQIGNIYTGSLYLSLVSFLDKASDLEESDRLGLFSYGSGAVGEFFSISLQEGFKEKLESNLSGPNLEDRRALTMAEYEEMIAFSLPKDGSLYDTDQGYHTSGDFVLDKVDQHIRYYKRL